MKDKNYVDGAFETIYQKTKKEYAPQRIDYTPLDEQTLAERIGAVLRPVYDKAIAAIFRNNKRSDAELDADAISRGMGSSTFVTDVKRRQDSAAADDVNDLETEYGAKLSDQLYKAMEGERDRLLEVEKFNAQQQRAAEEQAFSAAKVLYSAYLAEKKRRSGGSGSKRKQEAAAEEKPDEGQMRTSLAQAVAAARGALPTDPNGPGFYATADETLVDRVVDSDLPRYVKMRRKMNGDLTAREVEKFRQARPK